MNAQRKVLYGSCLIGSLILLLFFSILFYKMQRENALDSYYRGEILTMSPDKTAEELEKDGYLNLTNIQEGHNADINLFLRSDSIFRPVILKTFQEIDDDLVIRYFYRPDGSTTVLMTTYFVTEQRSFNMNCPFSTELSETVNESGITEVWLIQPEELRTTMPHHPVSDPVLFYSYRSS